MNGEKDTDGGNRLTLDEGEYAGAEIKTGGARTSHNQAQTRSVGSMSRPEPPPRPPVRARVMDAIAESRYRATLHHNEAEMHQARHARAIKALAMIERYPEIAELLDLLEGI